MNYVLLGVPGQEKQKLADLVQERLPHLRVFGDATSLVYRHRYALGSLADYRIELHLALERALGLISAKADGTDMFVIGSPIDNLAYAAVNYSESQDTILTDKEQLTWAATINLIYLMLVDSFDVDLVFYLPLKEREDTVRGAVDALYSDILEELKIDDYVVLDGVSEQTADLCAKMITLNQEAKSDTSNNMAPHREGGRGLATPSEEESSGQGSDADPEDLSDNE